MRISDWSSDVCSSDLFSEVGKKTPLFARFSTVAGERGAADAERDIRGFALKFYTEEGNWDIVGNSTPVFFFRDPLRFSDLNHAIKRSEEHTSELQSLMRISYAVFCLKKNKKHE